MYTEEKLKERANKESGIDIDWFFFDSAGRVAVVASGGGMLPNSVSTDMDRLKKMISYFRSLPVLSTDILIEESVLQNIQNYNEDQKIAYLCDLYYMCSRGLYYFDKVVLNDYSDVRYYLKATPKIPLILDMEDSDTMSILPGTFIEDDMNRMKIFPVDKVE